MPAFRESYLKYFLKEHGQEWDGKISNEFYL